MTDPLILLAHGSRDPRAALHTRALARAVAAARPGSTVRPAYLELAAPDLASVVDGPATVVPLLLTAAYHGRVDVPAVVDQVGRDHPLALAQVLVPPADPYAVDLIVAALRRRLDEVVSVPPRAVVLAAAGSRDRAALATVESVAARLGHLLGVPARAGYAAGAGPSVADAVRALDRPVIASYFLAPGLLHDRIRDQAGGSVVAPPLSAAPELVSLVWHRAATARRVEVATLVAA